ncbi:unnamed protein product [Angiostrongylus costaricensis]|uniref:Uncharacterized protein n=1 Tax=Angiostrongylus costaricensis TaxID=334426 RepID=A0A0R3Q147_ANGCS|nr:unnamed protein product [Angiostrongylus costaricensis]
MVQLSNFYSAEASTSLIPRMSLKNLKKSRGKAIKKYVTPTLRNSRGSFSLLVRLDGAKCQRARALSAPDSSFLPETT